MNIIFFLLSIVIFSTHAMEHHTQEKQSAHTKPNIPRYDASIKQFTTQPLMLKTISSKRVAKNIAEHFKTISEDNIDTIAQEVDTSILLDLQPLVARYASVEASQAGYVFDYIHNEQLNHEKDENRWSFEIGYDAVIMKHQDCKQEFKFDSMVLNLCESPQQKTIAITNYNTFKFFGRKNDRWEFLADQPSTQSKILGFLDDSTALSIDEKRLRIYSLDNDKILRTDKTIVRHLVSSKSNKSIPVLFLFDDTGTLFVCYKKNNEVKLEKIKRMFSSTIPVFNSVVISDDKKNIAVSFLDRFDILLFAMIEQAPVLIKTLRYQSDSITQLEDGFINVEKQFYLRPPFDDKPHLARQHNCIDIETGGIISSLWHQNHCQLITNMPLNALLTSIALKNSDNKPQALLKLKESKTLQELPKEFKTSMLEKIEKLLKNQKL